MVLVMDMDEIIDELNKWEIQKAKEYMKVIEENRILKEKLKLANENIQELVYKIESIKQSN